MRRLEPYGALQPAWALKIHRLALGEAHQLALLTMVCPSIFTPNQGPHGEIITFSQVPNLKQLSICWDINPRKFENYARPGYGPPIKCLILLKKAFHFEIHIHVFRWTAKGGRHTIASAALQGTTLTMSWLADKYEHVTKKVTLTVMLRRHFGWSCI